MTAESAQIERPVQRGRKAHGPAARVVALLGLSLMATLPSGAAVGDCPISADFGEAAETTKEQSPVAGKNVVVTLTRAFVEGGMVAVECSNLSADEAFPGMSDEQILLNYLTFYNLSPIDNGRGGIDRFSSTSSPCVGDRFE